MFKRFFVCTLALVMMICMAGCGEEKKETGTADKAVLAFAELIVQGESNNSAAAGINDADKNEIRKEFVNAFIQGLEDIVPLTDESAEAIVGKFYAKFKKDMKFSATIKKDDPENPVVEFKTTPMDNEGATNAAASNDDLIALIGMTAQLKADGATNDQLKSNAEVQKLAVTALTKYVESIPLQAEQTFDVTCNKVKGSDGKMYWAPTDIKAFTNFLTGQK